MLLAPAVRRSLSRGVSRVCAGDPADEQGAAVESEHADHSEHHRHSGEPTHDHVVPPIRSRQY